MKTNFKEDYSHLKKRYEGLFTYTNDLILILNPQGTVIKANEKALYGFGQSIIGSNIKDIFNTKEVSMSLITNTEIVQSVHVHSSRKNKDNLSLRLTFVPVINNEAVDELMVICKDMREIESYQGEIEALKKSVEELEEEKELEEMRKSNKNSSSDLASALKRLEDTKQKLEEMNNKLTKELELAAVLQNSLIPHEIPEHDFLNIAFHFEPMELVGGDYYDVIDLGRQRKGVIIVDVSGHGVSSAFIAAMIKVSFLNYSQKYLSPAAVLDKLNREYCSVIQTGDYATAFYAVFDPLNKKMTCCGAGHPKPFLLHSRTGQVEFLHSEGFFIGMFEEAKYSDTTIDFREGDRYLVFTDGIIEAYSDERNEQFGDYRLLESFKKHHEESGDHMIQSIIADVKGFMQKSRFYDDFAIVAVDYKKKTSGK